MWKIVRRRKQNGIFHSWQILTITVSLSFKGTSPKTQAYNLPRSCLRNYFSPLWCFVFERPANGEKMRRMEDLTDADLEPDFVQQSKDFCTHVFTNAKTKTLKGGLLVTGRCEYYRKPNFHPVT